MKNGRILLHKHPDDISFRLPAASTGLNPSDNRSVCYFSNLPAWIQTDDTRLSHYFLHNIKPDQLFHITARNPVPHHRNILS